ncbi:MAG TPA: YbhB/YbcL family Raf kinase inhibitor-like protein [Candidatus Faecisoma merdavium]|nr:YbhB/YbcL family Raf kinase inhibitor-like protein [Candidatus Faecisoma merdavium]
MQIKSKGIVNGVINDKYGKRGNMNLSIPLEFINYPKETKSFAVIIEDFDAILVCGHDFVHWLVANITTPYLEENASLNVHNFIEGKNDFGRTNYGGMAPPDRPHYYDITVYALDCLLDLKDGFSYNELKSSIKNHILDEANIKGLYNN